MSKPHRFIPRHSHHPFEVLLLVACVLSGAVGLISPDSHSAVQTLLPRFEVAWDICLLVAGSISLISLPLAAPFGLLVERAGMILLSATLLIYGGAIFATGGVTPGAVVVCAFGVGAAWRLFQITRDLLTIRRTIRGLREFNDDQPLGG